MYLVWKSNFFNYFSLETKLTYKLNKNTIIYISKSRGVNDEIYVDGFGIRTFLPVLVWNPNFFRLKNTNYGKKCLFNSFLYIYIKLDVV